jgi:hypothetical protein
MDALIAEKQANVELHESLQATLLQRYWHTLHMLTTAYNEANQDAAGEYMITLLCESCTVQSASTAYRIHGHAWPLPQRSSAGYADVLVEVRGDKRIQPYIKHSSWARDRQPLEKYKSAANAREILLSTSSVNGRVLLEGNSNAFISKITITGSIAKLIRILIMCIVSHAISLLTHVPEISVTIIV